MISWAKSIASIADVVAGAHEIHAALVVHTIEGVLSGNPDGEASSLGRQITGQIVSVRRAALNGLGLCKKINLNENKIHMQKLTMLSGAGGHGHVVGDDLRPLHGDQRPDGVDQVHVGEQSGAEHAGERQAFFHRTSNT